MLKNVAQCQRRRLPLSIIFSRRVSIFLGRLQMTAKVWEIFSSYFIFPPVDTSIILLMERCSEMPEQYEPI